MGHQLIGCKTVELETSLERVVKVSIVGRVTEHACSHDVLEVVSFRMAPRKEVIPPEGQPAREGCRTVKTAVTTLEIVSLVDGEGIPPQSSREAGHAAIPLTPKAVDFLGFSDVRQTLSHIIMMISPLIQ
jgi:hypothetical protein